MAVVLGAVLGAQDYRFAMNFHGRYDMDSSFFPAARKIAEGHSPYEVAGYVYSPLYAILLAPLVRHPQAAAIATAATIIAGILACWIAGFASTRGLPLWKRGLVVDLAVVSLLWNANTRSTLLQLNPQFLVLLCLVIAGFTARFKSGFALGLSAAFKTWPVVSVLWLLIGKPHRIHRLTGFLAAGCLTVLMAIGVGGSRGPWDMLAAATGAADQNASAYSVPGAARVLLHRSTLVVGYLMLALLAAMVLLRPGSRALSLFNLLSLLLLSLPVSHNTYLVLHPAGPVAVGCRSPAHQEAHPPAGHLRSPDLVDTRPGDCAQGNLRPASDDDPRVSPRLPHDCGGSNREYPGRCPSAPRARPDSAKLSGLGRFSQLAHSRLAGPPHDQPSYDQPPSDQHGMW